MPPVDKAKAAGVSASSFFDLKAEIAKKEEEFAKVRASGKEAYIVGGVKRDDKKISQWAKANPGVHARAARDIELEEISKPTLESARAILERKAKVYDKLRKGKSGGLDDKQYGELLVDFEQKGIDPYFSSDSDDVDESLTVPVPPDGEEDDPIMEYLDEYGRTRTARRSEIPRDRLPQAGKEEEEDFDPYVIHNPVDHFPVYEQSEERAEEIKRRLAEESKPPTIHYDASREVRAKGAGFYQFSADEETRRKQMEELRKAREETQKTRAETGAEDVRPGEVEGMHSGAEASTTSTKSRAMEKRKREIEERRKLLEAKRRKVVGKEGTPAANASLAPDSGKSTPLPAVAQPTDPFAALEAQTSDTKGKTKVVETPVNPADAFLAQLEQDIMKGKER
ncbi:hypothetical protein C8Q70DRAFT_1051816 [Cubamyces menziesii]|nr:hypothetical protein C8Q70DRAFT_1051816 [Cubamyces menziesii]